MEAKTIILERIKAAKATPAEAKRIPVRPSDRSRKEIVEQFAEYAAEYKATLYRTNQVDLSKTIQAAITERNSKTLIVAPDFPTDLLPKNLESTKDAQHGHAALEQFDCVVTTCALAVAETGSLVLDAGKGQGRRAISLVPDHHICIVMEDQIVGSVPEAVAALADSVNKGQPLTWISGPSATSDIELDRVEGVHGPRKLDIVIVASGA